MKLISLAVGIAELCILALQSEAQSSWNFQFRYENIFSSNALNYVVQQQNIQRVNEGDGITYWCPINNGTEAVLTQEFTFPGPTTQIYLNTGFYMANFGGGDYGNGSLWGSKDGVNWILITNAPTPSITAYDVWWTTNLPNALVGSTQIWIQAQMESSGWDIMAQFNRNGDTNYTFELDADYVVPPVVSLGFSPTLTISGNVGAIYTIQVSTNLSNSNAWTIVTNLTLTQTTQTWVDTSVNASSPLNPARFYQVLPSSQ